MTRKTLKGGLAGYLARGTSKIMGKTAKGAQNTLIERNATGKMFSLSNPKTFMGKKLKVHAYGLQEVAKKVFDFARKYEKYSRICRKDKEQCLVDVETDKKNLIKEIKKLPPLTNLTIKDPRGNYTKTEIKKQLRKEDVLFLFRVNLLLNKWNEDSNFLTGYEVLFNDDTITKGNSTINLEEEFHKETKRLEIVKFNDDTITKGNSTINLEEEFHKETKRLEIVKFNDLYSSQYEFVAENAKKTETESTNSSQVTEYIQGIKEVTEKDNENKEAEYKFAGKKYNLTKKRRPDKITFEYTIEPKTVPPA